MTLRPATTPVPNLPAPYAWLAHETGPRILLEALALFGTKETPGASSNASILSWARETGVAGAYVNDGIAWRGLFVAVLSKRAGFEPVKPPPCGPATGQRSGPRRTRPAWATSWCSSAPRGGGHVGLYVGEDATTFFVLGGNQSDQVYVSRIAKSRLLAVRRCPWKISQPSGVRPVRLAAGGTLSTNEA